MCHALLSDSTFYNLLLEFDRDLAEQARAAGCPCGGALHRADYPRKPRGGPADLPAQYKRRLSFCCAREGCRRRTTPASVRFLGRRVYLAVVVVLATAMRDGLTARGAARLHELVGVSLRTLKRWRAWWREAFPGSAFWQGVRGRFCPPVDVAGLCGSLVERFAGENDAVRLIRTLAFIGPVTTASAGMGPGCEMLVGDPQRMHLFRLWRGA